MDSMHDPWKMTIRKMTQIDRTLIEKGIKSDIHGAQNVTRKEKMTAGKRWKMTTENDFTAMQEITATVIYYKDIFTR